MALIDKLTAIADAVRGKTGGTDLLTLDGMAAAISGISSGGLPAGIAECEVQTFTPEADTNDPITFELGMEEMPTHIMIAADFPSIVARSFIAYYGGFPAEDPAGDGTINMAGRIKFYTVSGIADVLTTQNSNDKNRTGLWNLTNKGFTFRSNLYGSTFTYFRAGYTYTVVALRMVTL